MPRVLVLARFFPPIGGAGVHRTVGSVRYLRDHGYEPVVLTGPGQQRGRWDAHDRDLLHRIPPGVAVHRVEGSEPEGSTGLAHRLTRVQGRPEHWVRWWVDECVELGRRIAAETPVDLILTSCAPYETALAGARLGEELGVPWVADLEDPWALDEMRLHPTGLHQAVDIRRMRRALGSASAIVMAAPEAAKRVRRLMPERRDGSVAGIPIGFEPSDFDVPAASRPDGVFRIVHTGSMHTELGLDVRRTRTRRRLLGGTSRGLDILTRSHVFLLEAIETLLTADPALRGRVELVLAGDLTDADRTVARRHDFVHARGLLSHRETAALMKSADLLFLPMHDLHPGTRAGLIPYKTYEYMGARRPILAAVPDGDVRDMLGPLEHASLVRPSDVGGMAAVLRDRLARTGAGVRVPTEALRAFERRQCVAQIAEVLDSVLVGGVVRAHRAA